MNRRILVLIAILGFILPCTASRAETNALLSPEYLSEVVRHLYRWYLDETALLRIDDQPEIEILVRRLHPELDAGDLSQYAEVLVPQLAYVLTLKWADYMVPDLNLHIENGGFRILRAEKYDSPPAPREAYNVIRLAKRQLMEYLFATRNKAEFPDEAMRERMRAALRRQGEASDRRVPTQAQTYYVAPISPVANDLWVYWESGGMIIRFSSDTDLASKAYWEYEKLGVRVYDLREHVVVSMAEAAGSNAYVTRDWAARVLFNCVVHGQRLIIEPGQDPTVPMKVRESPAVRDPAAGRQ